MAILRSDGTAGAVLGGYTTYRLARGEAKGRFGTVFSRLKMDRVKALFEKWGFWSITIPAILPPPFPMVPFLLAAGAAQYPRNRFIAALALGRAVRYSILGVLGYFYGRWIITVMRQHVEIIIVLGTVIVLASIAVALIRLKNESAFAR